MLPQEKGGPNTLNLTEFDNSLITTWVYKSFHTEPEWLDFALIEKIGRLPWTGETYYTMLLNNAKKSLLGKCY